MAAVVDLLCDEHSLGIFVLLTVILGGGAAWLAGRANALNWRPWWQLAFFMLILGAAVRFMHFALFDSRLLSLHYYLVDAAVCLAFGLLGFRLMRVSQMVTRYGWINARSGPFRWRRRMAGVALAVLVHDPRKSVTRNSDDTASV
jgi:hypothetical protein